MKRTLLVCTLLSYVSFVSAQTSLDTTRKKLTVKQEVDTSLKQQKENIITASTIIKIENLGQLVNSEWAELRPTVSADGNLLFFIVENHPANTKYASINNSQDIWFSERDSNGTWSEAYHLGYPINTAHYNAVFWISPDNNRILLRNAFIDGAYHGKGLSMSYLKETGNWSEPNAMNIKNFAKYNQGAQYGATMAHDGKTLLMYICPSRKAVITMTCMFPS